MFIEVKHILPGGANVPEQMLPRQTTFPEFSIVKARFVGPSLNGGNCLKQHFSLIREAIKGNICNFRHRPKRGGGVEKPNIFVALLESFRLPIGEF